VELVWDTRRTSGISLWRLWNMTRI
ncbi:unnamed protein product, partial [Allacma fusca]